MEKDYKTVLVVEDSMVQSSALAQLLKREGLQVLCASNGRIGMSMTQQCTPDAIVLDFETFEMNGIETFWRLKEAAQAAGIPIVVLAVRDKLVVLMQGIGLGALEFIPKDDFSYKVLLETFRRLHILE